MMGRLGWRQGELRTKLERTRARGMSKTAISTCDSNIRLDFFNYLGMWSGEPRDHVV